MPPYQRPRTRPPPPPPPSRWLQPTLEVAEEVEPLPLRRADSSPPSMWLGSPSLRHLPDRLVRSQHPLTDERPAFCSASHAQVAPA
jgi:hypothetical protein